jgi:hypothetical protein
MTPFLRRGCCLLSLFAVLLFLPGGASAQKLRIDSVDTSKFAEHGRLRFFIDLVGRDGRPAKEVAPEALTISVDDKPLEGKREIHAFKDTSEQAAVTFILAAHMDYHAPIDGETTPFDMGLEGVSRFVSEMRQDDRVSLWCYSQRGMRRVAAFTEGGQSTADDFARQARRVCRPTEQDAARTTTRAPSLYKDLISGFQRSLRDDFDKEVTARQRIVILMSDGNDEIAKRPDGPDRIGQYIRDIEEEISGEIKVHAIALSEFPDNFSYLDQLCRATHGVMTEVETPITLGGTNRIWDDLADRVKRQVVVDFEPDDLDGGQGVKFQLGAEVNGTVASAVNDSMTRLPERPLDWKGILIMIAKVLGAILGVVLLGFLVITFIRSRGGDEDEDEDDGQPTGPVRGRLVVTKGPLAGQEFYLVEDVTTIGSMDSNDIILSDASVSKRHAGIKIDKMRYELADFGSTNGVLVNGRKISKQFLGDGDEIRIGTTEVIFHLK